MHLVLTKKLEPTKPNKMQMGIQTNFDFLKENYADLLQLALLAERNCYSDPSTSLSKLRILSEKLAIILIDIEQLEDPYDNRQITRLNSLANTKL